MPFVLRIRDEFVQARVVDYSLDGVGIVLEDPAEVQQGEAVDLVLSEPDIEAEGTVIWKRTSGGETRIGVHTTGGLKGLIRDFRLADTVIGLQRNRATGILSVETGDATRKIYVSNGDMVYATSDHQKDTLCQLLFREGRLASGQLAKVLEEAAGSRQKEAAVLVRLGYLAPRDLMAAVRLQVEEIIVSIFAIGEGQFHFEAMPLPKHEVIALKLSAANLIFSGIMRVDDLSFIERDFPPRSGIITLSQDPLDLYQDLKLDDGAARVIIASVGRGASIARILRSCGLAEAEAVKTIYALLSVKMLTLSETGAEEDYEEIVEPSFDGLEEEAGLDPALRSEIEELHGRYLEIGYYGILGIKQESTMAEIKTAYYRAAKKFHPDIHFALADDSLKDKLSDIFSYVGEAYMTLSDPSRRQEYNALINERPANPVSNSERAQEKFREGRELLKRGKFEEASLLLGQAVYFDQHKAEYQYYFGLSLVRQKKFKAAERAIFRALAIDSENPVYLTEHGFIFLELGCPSRALHIFEKVLRIAPDSAPAMAGIKRVREIEERA